MDYQNKAALKTKTMSNNRYKISGKLAPRRDHKGCNFNANLDVQSANRITYSVSADSPQPISKPFLSIRFGKNMQDRPIYLRLTQKGSPHISSDLRWTQNAKAGGYGALLQARMSMK